MRVSLHEAVAAGKSTEVVIGFKGNVPEVDGDETGLTTHVVKQVSAALRAERETRRPRDVNFRCKGVMLLGTSYPVLAVHDGEQWLRKLEPSVGDIVFNEVADYEVKIEVAPDVVVFTSAGEDENQPDKGKATLFSARALRDFAIIAGRNLRSEQKEVGETTLRSIFLPEHAAVGKRVLAMRGFFKSFQIKIWPTAVQDNQHCRSSLVAGLGSTEFSGFDVIASATMWI